MERSPIGSLCARPRHPNGCVRKWSCGGNDYLIWMIRIAIGYLAYSSTFTFWFRAIVLQKLVFRWMTHFVGSIGGRLVGTLRARSIDIWLLSKATMNS